MIMNGTKDPLMPSKGGPVSKVAEPVRFLAETVNYWVEVNGADAASPKTTMLPDADPEDRCRVRSTAFSRPGEDIAARPYGAWRRGA